VSVWVYWTNIFDISGVTNSVSTSIRGAATEVAVNNLDWVPKAAIEQLADNPEMMAKYRQYALEAAPRYDRKALAGDMLESLTKVTRKGG